jgi:8-oxo-dGTP pyrophosphatase MutT (NUDIX family)
LNLNLDALTSLYPNGLDPPLPNSKSKPASVLIPIFRDTKGRDCVVLTKRSEHLKNHPGQISFPGGVQSGSETLLDTALREWEEEVGESKETIKPLGSFGEFNTFTGFIIVPFLGIYTGNFNFKPNAGEVARMILLNLDAFNQDPFYEMENPRSPGKRVYYLELDKDILWGATASILVDLLIQFGSFHRQGIKIYSNLNKSPYFDPSKEYQLQP